VPSRDSICRRWSSYTPNKRDNRTMFVQQVLALLAKDLKTEWRTREVLTSTFVFAVLVVVVFNFAIGADPALIRQVAPGVLWVALVFAMVLGLHRAVHLESDEDCLQGVLLALGDRSALFVAKMIGNMLYLLVVAGCTLPLFSIWFRIDLTARLVALGVVLCLGMLGLSAVGTLFALLALNTRMREVMLPLLLLPVSIPLTIGAVYATAALIDGKRLADITDYLTLMGVFDVVFVVLAVLVFDYIVEE
jgi:heme exporter protein B